ncbi:MAG: aconitase X catalytic domain-containing protein [Mollicutes bacterium]|nr:aconitase X catalytic domain-containing protein [Mollicutes bacterium]MDD7043392.1 aconitase X [Mollicutes bacterium]MDY6070390.1 aconitase X [Bacilli bacterium]
MYQAKMKLNQEEQDILAGKQGKTMAKMMEVLVRYGDAFGADCLVPVTHKKAHFVTSFGLGLLKGVYPLMDELIAAGCKVEGGFSMDPRPLDYKNVKCDPLEKLVFNNFMYNKQKVYEEQLQKIGLKDPEDAFSCTCYLKEMGNTPKKGDILSWSESSAVVFANSVLGARCNRNSGILDMFGAILGKTPNFGFITDEGRKADWKIILKTSKKPEAQILGSAIGIKVMAEVPYVVGLDKYLKDLPDEDTLAYLKDFGAATASNGAVGLYHIENITPEAKELGTKLLKDNVKEYVIDDAELERIYKSYPIMWKKMDAKVHRCFIGCPHLTLKQLENWTDDIVNGLKKSGKKKLVIDTVLTSSPAVIKEFQKEERYQKLLATGAHVSYICPLMYADNPISGKKVLMTNSNKLRTYTKARYFKDQEVLEMITGQKEVK